MIGLSVSRIRLALLISLAALPLSGCERLCMAGAITWCERSEGDGLNDPPGFLQLWIDGRTPARMVPVEFGQTLRFSGTADDPDSTDVIDPESEEVEVVPASSGPNAPPTASFTVTPNPARSRARSCSTRPDPAIRTGAPATTGT